VDNIILIYIYIEFVKNSFISDTVMIKATLRETGTLAKDQTILETRIKTP